MGVCTCSPVVQHRAQEKAMQALLGKITQITPKETPGDGRLPAFEIRFKPACVLPRRTIRFEVTCDKLKAGCTVVPQDGPYAARLLLPEGERHRLESDWYVVDIEPGSHGGGIEALREKGRGVDHFRRPEDRIQDAL